MSPRKLFLPLVLLAVLARAAGCGSPSAPADVGVAAGPATGFSGPISPQGGTITGVFGSGALGGSALGGFAYVFLNSCPEGQTWISLGSGSGYACAVAATPSTADEGDLLVQGSGELDAYAGNTCSSGFATALSAAGVLTCSTPTGLISGLTSPDLVVATGATTVGNFAGKACVSGWATATAADGSLTCSTPTPSGLAHVVCYTTLTTGTVNDWSPTCAGSVSASAADTWVITSSTGTITLTGILASLSGGDGGTKLVVNQSGQMVDLTNGGTGSVAADRFLTINAYSRFIGNAGSFQITYQGSAALWTEHDESSRYTNNIYDEGAATFAGSIAISTGFLDSGTVPSATGFQNGWSVYGSASVGTAVRDYYEGVYGPGCGYGVNGSEVCWGNTTGYNLGLTQPRSQCYGDGEGSGSGHAIACLDAGTHSLFIAPSGTGVGSAFAPAGPNISVASSAPSGSCTAGSVEQVISGTVYACRGGAWEAVASVNAALYAGRVPAMGAIPASPDSTTPSSTMVNSTIQVVVGLGGSNGTLIDDGTTAGNNICEFVPAGVSGTNSRLYCGAEGDGDDDFKNVGGFDAHAGSGSEILDLGATGTACPINIGESGSTIAVTGTTSISGTTTVNTTTSATTSIGNTSSALALAASDVTLTAVHFLLEAPGAAPSVSCTSGTATCSGCSNGAGVITTSGAEHCTLTYAAGAWANTPACVLTPVITSSVLTAIELEAHSASSFEFSDFNGNGITTFTGDVNYICIASH